jgi:hypothetical protein
LALANGTNRRGLHVSKLNNERRPLRSSGLADPRCANGRWGYTASTSRD